VTAKEFGSPARAVYDLAARRALAAVELPASREKIFPMLTGPEVTLWWVNPGVFDTRDWAADVRPGGRWRAAGTGRGMPYALEGEFSEVEPPKRLVYTWRAVGSPDPQTAVTYLLDTIPVGTRLTDRHEGILSLESLARTSIGWETSLEALRGLLTPP